MRTLVWVCVCSTSAALVPFELFGVPRRTAQLGSAGSDTSLPKIVTSAAASTLYNFFVLTEEQKAELEKGLQEDSDRLQESRDRTEASRLKMIQAYKSLFDELLGSGWLMNFWGNIFDRPDPSHKAYQAESPPRAPERQLDREASQQQLSDQRGVAYDVAYDVAYHVSDQLFRGLSRDQLLQMLPREQASALEGVGRLEPLSSAERYDEVEALRQAFKRLEQEFDRLEQSEPPTEGELQAARLLWMRRGEAYELWLDMLEKLHELEGNEEKLRTLKDERARNIQIYGPRLDTRARLERAFLDES